MTTGEGGGHTIAQLMYLRVQLEQALAAVKTTLDAEALRRYTDDQAAQTWRLYGDAARLSTKETHDRLQVDDPETFRTYMAGRFPHQYRSVHTWEAINPAWEKKLLEQWAELGGYDPEGTRPPGTSLVVGGEYAGTSLTATAELKEGLLAHALDALNRGALRRALGAALSGGEDDGNKAGVPDTEGGDGRGTADLPPGHGQPAGTGGDDTGQLPGAPEVAAGPGEALPG